MRAIAIEKLRHFTDDFFFHDSWTLGLENPNRFIWMIRKSGTWLVTESGKFYDGIVDYQRRNNENELYYWDGITLYQFDNSHLDDFYRLLKFRPDTINLPEVYEGK